MFKINRNNIAASEQFVEDQLLEIRSDWYQSDPSQKNFIKNRPFYEEFQPYITWDGKSGEYSLYWDGNNYYQVSTDALEDYTHFIGGKVLLSDGTSVNIIKVYRYETDFGYGSKIELDGAPYWIYATTDPDGVVEPQNMYVYLPGVHYPIDDNGVYVQGVLVPENICKLDEKFLPEPVVKCHTAEAGQIIVVKSVNENGVPVEWEAVDAQNNQRYLTLCDINTGYKHYVFIEDGYVNSTIAITGIKVLSNPTKLDYTDSDVFDPSGMIVASVLPNGKEIVITNDVTYDKFVTLGSTNHIITYTEVDGTVHTTEVPIITRSLEVALDDFIYTTNDDGTYTIDGWKETLNGEPSTKCLVPNSELVII